MKNICPNFPPLTESQQKTLRIESSVLAVIYTIFLLVPLLHNIYHFLYLQKRYRVCTVTVFYTFASILVLARVTGFILYSAFDNMDQLVNTIFVVAAFSKYCIGVYQCVSQQEFFVRLRANIALVISNESPELIKSLLVRKIKILRYTLALVLVGAMSVCFGYLLWEIRNSLATYSKLTMTLIAAFLGLQDTLMIISYLVLFRVLQKYFDDYLSKQRNQLLTVFGIMVLSVLVQTLYFLAEVKSFFCRSFTVQILDTVMTLAWDLPVVLGIIYLHNSQFSLPSEPVYFVQ
jgi:hypothetical protein